MTGIGSGLEVEQHHQHVHRPAVAGKRQQQPVNVVGCASREVRERLKRVQRPAVLGNAVVLFEDNRIGLEELDILEGLARAILAAGSDDVGAHEAIAVTSRLAENVNQHQIR
jgi:hypothetical protein